MSEPNPVSPPPPGPVPLVGLLTVGTLSPDVPGGLDALRRGIFARSGAVLPEPVESSPAPPPAPPTPSPALAVPPARPAVTRPAVEAVYESVAVAGCRVPAARLRDRLNALTGDGQPPTLVEHFRTGSLGLDVDGIVLDIVSPFVPWLGPRAALVTKVIALAHAGLDVVVGRVIAATGFGDEVGAVRAGGLGLGVRATDGRDDPTALRLRLQAELVRAGLWESDSFDLWVVLVRSMVPAESPTTQGGAT